jgi:hypothetical protein
MGTPLVGQRTLLLHRPSSTRAVPVPSGRTASPSSISTVLQRQSEGTTHLPAAVRPLPAAEAESRPTGFVALDDGRVIEWAHDLADPIDAVATVQRADGNPAAPAEDAGITPSTVTSAVATTGPAAPAPATPKRRSDAEISELCQALYGPLRRRLCRDLLLDRERAGYRTDIRF